MRTATTLNDKKTADFDALDADSLRVSLINRYAHMLYGDLTRTKPHDYDNTLTVRMTVEKTLNRVTFITPTEQSHLKHNVMNAIKARQARRECERWRSEYEVLSITVTAVDDHIDILICATIVRAF
jgi:hypothetical protein